RANRRRRLQRRARSEARRPRVRRRPGDVLSGRLRRDTEANRCVRGTLGRMTRLLLIRHGLTDAVGHHLAGIAPGTHLNDVGLAQVAALVARLHDVPLTAIVSSPLERTRETAEPIANDHAL